jgi:hypothetical protein
MKPFRTLWLILLLIPLVSVLPQNSIQLIVTPGLGSLDLGTFLMSNNLSGQPRIFQLIISTQPEGRNVFLKGEVDWKQNESANSQKVFDFQTKVFKARSLTNDEIGNSDIQLESINGDQSLAREIASRGKPSGVFYISISMFSENNEILDSPQSQTLTFLNPAPTISITFPVQNSFVDVGNVQANWTEVQGATRYEVQAGEIPENNPNVEDALQSGSLIVDARNISAGITSINLGNYLSRPWHDGQKIALLIKAIYLDSGKESEIRSEPVIFSLGQASYGPGNKKDETSETLQPDQNMQRVANLVNGKVEQSIIDKLKDGTIQLNQIQIEDENGQAISQADFLTILGMLEAKSASELTITYKPKQ